MSLRVLYRAAPAGGKKLRPAWFSKSTCLASFLRSFEEASDATLSFLVDGEVPPEVLVTMKAWGEVEQLPGVGNCRSYLAALSRLSEGSGRGRDGVMLCEDDYLHTEPAVPALEEALAKLEGGSYLTPYDHPDRYVRNDDWSVPGRPVEQIAGRFWKASESTTLTFATTRDTLQRDRNLLGAVARGTGYPHDRVMWRALQGLGPFRPVRWLRRPRRRLLSALPGLSTHCEPTELTVGVDWPACADAVRAWAVANGVGVYDGW